MRTIVKMLMAHKKLLYPSSWTANDVAGTISASSFPNARYVAYNSDRMEFLVVSKSTTAQDMWVTSDGINFTHYNFPGGAYEQKCAYGAGTYVLQTDTWTDVATSADASSWTNHAGVIALDSNAQWDCIQYLNSTFVLWTRRSSIGTGTWVYSSASGTSWSKSTVSTLANYNVSDMAYGNGVYVGVGSQGAFVSSDASSWTNYSMAAYGWYKVVFGANKFVAIDNVGSRIATSTDGQSWSDAAPAFGSLGAAPGLVYHDDWFVVTKNGTGQSWYSADASSWTALPTISAPLNWLSFNIYAGHNKVVSLRTDNTNTYQVACVLPFA